MVRDWGADTEKSVARVKTDELGAVYVPLAQVPSSAQSGYINWLRSVGGIAPGTTDAQWATQNQQRLESAYGAAVMGAPRAAIERILMGRQ